MYKEPHLNEKNEECSKLWYEWYDVQFVQKDKEKAKELRTKWCKCVDELSEMIHQAYLDMPYKPRMQETKWISI